MNPRQCFPFVVEDDDDFALLVRRAFLKAGVPNGNVRRYRNGEGALADLVSVDVIRPSVLLLDMGLPGMTGLWQVSGRIDLSFDDLVRLDFYYIENWSIWLDITILARTLPAVVARRGAY